MLAAVSLTVIAALAANVPAVTMMKPRDGFVTTTIVGDCTDKDQPAAIMHSFTLLQNTEKFRVLRSWDRYSDMVNRNLVDDDYLMRRPYGPLAKAVHDNWRKAARSSDKKGLRARFIDVFNKYVSEPCKHVLSLQSRLEQCNGGNLFAIDDELSAYFLMCEVADKAEPNHVYEEYYKPIFRAAREQRPKKPDLKSTSKAKIEQEPVEPTPYDGQWDFETPPRGGRSQRGSPRRSPKGSPKKN